MEQEIELIVSCHGLLTSVVGVFIVLEPLVQIGLAFGVVECVRGLVLLGNGRGTALVQLVTPVKEVVKLMKPITHPSRVLARCLIARNEAKAPIGGHADAVEAMIAQVGKMGFPGLGRAIGGRLKFQDGRALRLNRDPRWADGGQKSHRSDKTPLCVLPLRESTAKQLRRCGSVH